MSGAATYNYFCVLKVGTGAGTQTCADAVQGTGGTNVAGTSGSVTGLSPDTVYVCYVQSVDSNTPPCTSSCSSGVEYMTSSVGTSSMLVAPSLSTLVFVDGEDPTTGSLPLAQQPVSIYDETTCTNANEFPDERDPNAGRRALQIILNVEGWDRPSYTGALAIQAKFYKSLSNSIATQGYGDVCMRTFNVDNSQHGAGVKTRVWFNTQADCVGYATYIKGLMANNPVRGSNVFHDMDAAFSNADFGGVTIRMVTNPQSKCHKWTYPASAVCSQQLTYYSPGTTSQPGSLTRNNDSSKCTDEESVNDLLSSNMSDNGFQIIFSLKAKTKTGYDNDAVFAKHVILAFRKYLNQVGWSPDRIQIKAVDNSKAGVGLHMRFFSSGGQKSGCPTFAGLNWVADKSDTGSPSLFDLAENYLYNNVFAPYETMAANTVGAGTAAGPGAGYFGTVTRRASMQTCRNVGGSVPADNAANGPGSDGWAGSPSSVAYF